MLQNITELPQKHKHIGEALETLRKLVKKTRKEVSSAIGISPVWLEHIEKFRYGNKNLVSRETLDSLIVYYKPTNQQKEELNNLFHLQPSYLQLKNTQDLSLKQKELLFLFVKYLPSLSERSTERLVNLLHEELK